MAFDESIIRSTISSSRSLDVPTLVEILVSRDHQRGENFERPDTDSEQKRRDFCPNIHNLFEEVLENLTGDGN